MWNFRFLNLKIYGARDEFLTHLEKNDADYDHAISTKIYKTKKKAIKTFPKLWRD